MIIKELTLNKYRNYFYQNIKFAPGINIFLGDNAQGKTNLLESVYFGANAKSFKKVKDTNLIMFNETNMQLDLTIQKDSSFKKINIKVDRHGKSIVVNGIKYPNNKDISALFNIVLFTPEEMKIAKEGPSLRRDFIDDIIISVDDNYKRIKRRYQRLVFERNKLLKKPKTKFFDDEIYAFDVQIADYGARIIQYRKRYIEILSDYANTYLRNLTNHKENFRIEYRPDIDVATEKEYMNYLLDNRRKDLEQYSTTSGVHRDDINFLINDMNIRDFASQGQQRSAILVLKLSQIKLIKVKLQQKAIVLLDDVFSELDEKRSGFLLNNLEGYQTIITSTDFTNIEKINPNSIRKIKNGKIF